MPDNEDQSFKKTLKKRVAKEIPRADPLLHLEKRKQKNAHELAVIDRENSYKKDRINTWVFGVILTAIIFLLAAALLMLIFCETCKANTLAISSAISSLTFLLGTFMGIFISRRQ